MRNNDGLQPQEAFDELLKYLFIRENIDNANYELPSVSSPILDQELVILNQGLSDILRDKFRTSLDQANSWSAELWKDKIIRLSDMALLSVHEILENVDFSALSIDTRSAALNEFIPSELRKGLGIFPTPDGIARMMVEIAAPNNTASVFDPACGTGTFLIEVARRWDSGRAEAKKAHVWGADKNARMLLLSELNLGHKKELKYHGMLADTLYQKPANLFGKTRGGFDLILTNPPFGISIDRNKHDMTPFQTCRNNDGEIVRRQQSEVVFFEQCLKYLKPGALLGIILPRSVITNSSLRAARRAIGSLGHLETIINLPPETFCASGTQTNTVILFVRRYQSNQDKATPVSVIMLDITNVGFDATGRFREGSQLQDVPKILAAAKKKRASDTCVRVLSKIEKRLTFEHLPELLAGRMEASRNRNTVPLGDFLDIASNGRTPGRADYSDDGLFLVKVGNLTGQGIRWEARDRNFINGRSAEKYRANSRFMLLAGDILLTSSAHSPVYIAKKIDIVGSIPNWVGGEASYVGEVMLLRVKPPVSPYVVAAYLRLPSTQRQIQTLVRGQTAHLHPKDLLIMRLPKAFIKNPPADLRKAANLVKKEAELSQEMNKLVFEQRKAYHKVEAAL